MKIFFKNKKNRANNVKYLSIKNSCDNIKILKEGHMEVYIISKKEDFSEEQIARLEKVGKVVFIEQIGVDLSTAEFMNSKEEKIIAVNPDYTDWKFPDEVIERIPNLKGIALQTTGYSYIDTEFCKQKGIIITNIPKYSTDAVAEYAMFLMFAVARKLPLQIKSDWKESFTKGMMQRQVCGKKVGILGLGSIGTKLAELLSAIGMKVSYWSKNTRNEKYEYEELEDLFETCDFIFPTFAVNGQTKLIITDALLNSMKKSASLISIVGTEVFNLNILLNKVKANEIYGLAFESANDDIANYEGNVMITSPYAWYTKESFKNLIEKWTTVMESFKDGNPIHQI